MGIVSRFERKLQSAVGDTFARVFGGSVLPQEVETALEREAADQLRDLEGGHRLVPNSYVISINPSDHGRLAADHDLAVRTFSQHLDSYIRGQGWQTYGDVHVEFEPSPNLHTGQFRTRGRVDPDVGPNVANRPPRGPDRRPYPPQPGAGPMTQNPGHGPGSSAGEPDDESRYAPADAGAQRNGSFRASEGGAFRANEGGSFRAYGGFAGGAAQQRPGEPSGQGDDQYPQRSGQPQQPAYDNDPYRDQGYGNRGGYGQQQAGFDAPAPWEAPGYQDRYQNEPQQDQRSAPGYADHGYSNHGYPEHNPVEDGYRERGPVPEPSYQDPRYDGSYSPPAQPGAGYGGEAYAQQPGYAYPGYNAGHGRRDYGYNQQGGYDQGGYQAGYSATLQLDDGSGRTYQLREGSNVIGRGQDAHFRLPDTGVSRRHFEIRWDGQVAMLGDLGSTNGTSVNGATVQDWQLADGDVIRAGHSDIIVRIV